VCNEAALREHIAALDHAPSVRRHAAEDEPPSQTATHAAAAMHRRAPFAMKYVIFGYPRFLLRGLAGAQVETSFATLAYNLKTIIRVLGATQLLEMLAS
jgi:hypothetical protein